MLYIGSNKQDENIVIPYALIKRYDTYSDPQLFINDFINYLKSEYSNFSCTDILTGTIGQYQVYGVTTYYTLSSGENMVDNRYAIVMDNVVYMFATRELDVNTEEMNNLCKELITHFEKLGG